MKTTRRTNYFLIGTLAFAAIGCGITGYLNSEDAIVLFLCGISTVTSFLTVGIHIRQKRRQFLLVLLATVLPFTIGLAISHTRCAATETSLRGYPARHAILVREEMRNYDCRPYRTGFLLTCSLLPICLVHLLSKKKDVPNAMLDQQPIPVKPKDMVVKCACGVLIRLPQDCIGRRIMCPDCNKIARVAGPNGSHSRKRRQQTKSNPAKSLPFASARQ